MVEGFFEVFSVAALSFIFVSLGLVSRRTATVATITEAALFLIGGIQVLSTTYTSQVQPHQLSQLVHHSLHLK